MGNHPLPAGRNRARKRSRARPAWNFGTCRKRRRLAKIRTMVAPAWHWLDQAAAGLASSSAMMRRIDARISSIEGSWTFAGCVISDSTSSTPRMRFTPGKTGFAGSGYAGRDFHRTSLTCPQIKRHQTHRAGRRPCSGHRSVAAQDGSRMPNAARIALLPPAKVRHGNN